MKIIKIVFLTAGLVLATFFNLIAQEQMQIKPGDRIRVRIWSEPSKKYVGTLQTFVADTLVLQAKGETAPRLIPLASVKKFEFSKGKKSKIVTGAVVGFFGGAATGALVGLGLYPFVCEGAEKEEDYFCGLAIFLEGSVVGASAGLLLGTVIGATRRVDRWQAMPLERIRLGVSPYQNDGLLFSASFTF